MAIIKRGILGGFSNKIGNVVGTSWKGISVMRALPQSVHNPKTEAQEEQRTNFAVISKIGSAVLDSVIKPFWDKRAIRMSGYNLFVQKNLDNWRKWGTSWNDVIIFAEGAETRIDDLEVYPAQAALGFTLDVSANCSNIDYDNSRVVVVIMNSAANEVLAVRDQSIIDNQWSFKCVNSEVEDKFTGYAFIYDSVTMKTSGSQSFAIRVP